MSVATAFKYHRPFPFCPAVFDIDSLDYSTIGPRQFFIRDLTLADAMKLYWSLESIDFEFNASGVGFYVPTYPAPGTGTASISYTKALNALAYDPRERVCDDFSGGGRPGIGGESTTMAAGTIVYDDPGTPDDGFNSIIYYSAAQNFTNPSTCVTKQMDGAYTFWFELYELAAPIAAGGGGTYSETYNPSPTNFDYTDIAVLSGTIRIYGVAFTDAGVLEYTSGGTLGTVTFTPNFFTYA